MLSRTLILTLNPEDRLSVHFKAGEFKCLDGSNLILVDEELIKVLETVRSRFQKPVKINSGYRTYAYNKTVSYTNNSYHCKGMAADIAVKDTSPKIVQDFLEAEYPDKYGIGRYKNFTHIDVREEKARWEA